MATEKARTILVTGANRGIGFETVKQLLQKIDNENQKPKLIIATARNVDAATELQNLVATLREEGKDHPANRLLVVELDVTNEKSRKDMCQRIKEEEGEDFELDVLINNAGVYNGGAHPVFDTTAMMATNYYGPKEVSKLLEEEKMLQPKTSLIINLTSEIGGLGSSFSKLARNELMDADLQEAQLDRMVQNYIRQKQRGWQHDIYGASKTALNALTRIRTINEGTTDMTCVCPGWTRTELGGSNGSRSVEMGADTVIWLTRRFLEEEEREEKDADHPTPAGKWYRDKEVIPW